MTHFELLQKLCTTPRWAGMQTTRSESVMEHKALVLMYVHLLVHDTREYAECMRCAIAHDCEEAITGDLKYSFKTWQVLAVAKNAVEDASKNQPEYVAELLKYSLADNEVVDCADRLAAAHFWLNEKMRGNPDFTDGTQMYESLAKSVKSLKTFLYDNIVHERGLEMLEKFNKLKI